MWQYETTAVWKGAKEGRLHAHGNPEISIATPPDFGGPRNMWSPEDLLAGAVGSCLMTSAVFFLERAEVDLRSYTGTATGTMEKTKTGLAFTAVDTVITVTVGRKADVEAARQAIKRAEAACPVSHVLTCPVTVSINVGTCTEQQ